MKRILLIDDSELILESASTILKMEGYDVYTVDNIDDAYVMIKQNIPDLILCDISFPERKSFELLRVVKDNKDTQSTPFILLTVFTDKQAIKVGMKSGADGFMPKPFERDELLSLVSTQLAKSAIIDERITKRMMDVGKNLTYALPHEFRTPMNQIVFSAKYIQKHTDILDTDDIKELSGDIIDSATRLIAIIENYVVYSELIALSQDPVAMKELRNNITLEPGELLLDSGNNVAVKFDRHDDLKIGQLSQNIAIEASSEKYFYIINEALTNAFKFSSPGEEVTVSSWTDEEKFYFSVKDEGRGMTRDQVNKIGVMIQFERDRYEQQGLGLGLYIMKNLIKLHDGDFSIVTDNEKGIELIGSFALHD